MILLPLIIFENWVSIIGSILIIAINGPAIAELYICPATNEIPIKSRLVKNIKDGISPFLYDFLKLIIHSVINRNIAKYPPINRKSKKSISIVLSGIPNPKKLPIGLEL